MKTQSYLLNLILLFSLFILGNASIHSQNTQNTSEPAYFNKERPITYRKLNEALKYADYKYVADKRDSIQKGQLAIKDSIIDALKQINKNYKFKVVPNLEHQISLYKQSKSSNEELYAIRDEKWALKYDKLKSKRIGVGFSIGYGITPNSLQPYVGISLNYTLLRL